MVSEAEVREWIAIAIEREAQNAQEAVEAGARNSVKHGVFLGAVGILEEMREWLDAES